MYDDEYDDDFDDDFRDEYGDETSADTIPCSNCGTDVYEESEQCPVCGEYIIRGSSVYSGMPGWWIVLGALGILATTFALVLG